MSVSWTQGSETTPAVITWREVSGPQVREPSRRGLGMNLLARALAGAPGGRTHIEWAPEGLVCELSLGVASAVRRQA